MHLNDGSQRRLVGAAVVAMILVPWLAAGPAEARTPATEGQASSAAVASSSLGPLKHVKAGALDVAYAELGPAKGRVVILLHGWPYDIHAYDEVAPALAAKGYRVLVPYARGYGATRFLSADTPRNAEPVALARDVVDFMDALKVKRAVLGGFDWGARSADIVAALWPQRVDALVSVSGYLIGSQEAGRQPLPPKAEYQWWYQFYFATDRGEQGYGKYTHDFARLIWQLASPQWKFDDATFERSAAALDNPDQVALVVHNYRWRMGLAEGQPENAALEQQLASFPTIAVPTITMEGDANGAPHPAAEAYRKYFTGKYEYRLVSGGIGHNLPQEAPQAFVQAIVDVQQL